ncbi:MAG: O-antigen ligase family protein [Acidimicrobiia bacterium]
MTAVVEAPPPVLPAPPVPVAEPLVPVTQRRTARPLVDPAWPIIPLTLGMPIAYFAGFGALVWIVPALVFAVPMLRRRELRMPASALPLLGLILWIPITAIRLPDVTSFGVFLYRWLIWVATLSGMLWLCNTSTLRLASKRIVDMLAFLWIVLVGFGYLALLFPTTAVPSLLQRIMPTGLANSQFISDLTIIRFAELQTFVTGSVPRPAAPLPATNGWGSTLALLLPFFILSWLLAPSPRRRIAGWVLVVAGVVPLAISTNRGAWLSIGLGLVYFAARRAAQGDWRPLLAVGAAGVVACTLVLATPLDAVVSTRLSETAASNTTREDVYRLAYSKTLESPLLGYGAPESADHSPPIGTHGLIWYAMFSHGFPALALLIVALLGLFGASFRARTPTALWAHICIFMCITQLPYYGLLPQFVLVGLAAGICWRENHPELMPDA